ncbi:MAG: 4'-phosphopantetheinyl transferase superfamily protein [Bacteroidaceae bacterium]|nr:4'-phosphopantetheinyl transferase superfamily protein [Bacteroidaceae bacterium]
MKLYLNDHLQDFDLREALAQLSDQRREQALKFRHEQGQRTCAAAYLLLCRALAQEYGITERPLFGYGEHGKPYIIGHEDIHFNLSHCREVALCVVSDRPVGVDVESVRPLKDGLVEYTMNEREVARIRQAADPALEFTRLWTQKEAVLKLSGEGINNHLKAVLDREDVTWHTCDGPDARYVYTVCQFA